MTEREHRRAARARIAALILSALTPSLALAYLPVGLEGASGKHDFALSEAIVIGRVTRIERFSDPLGAGSDAACFSCIATVTVGRTLKGPLKRGDEFLIRIGEYILKGDDNARPVRMALFNTQRPWPMRFNGVYLLCLRRVPDERVARPAWKGKLWQPQSFYYSIHELVGAIDPTTRKWVICVREGQWRGKPKPLVSLDAFLKQRGYDPRGQPFEDRPEREE